MKANAIFNTSLFRKSEQTTLAITSGIMICHPINEPGNYDGIVLKEQQQVGRFTIQCTKDAPRQQADIDLFKINNLNTSDCCCDDTQTFTISPEGYAVFYSSFGEGGYEVVLTDQNADRQQITYSTRKLQPRDIVVVMFMQPGDYEVNGPNGQKCLISVDMPANNNEYQKMMMEPINITVNPTDFSNKEAKAVPGQGVVLMLETEGGINSKLIKAREVPPLTRERKHTWENPKYKQ